MPLTVYVHAPSRQWTADSYAKGLTSSSAQALLDDMCKTARYPQKGYGCYLSRNGAVPSWLNPENKNGGMFAPSKPFTAVTSETLTYLQFGIDERVVLRKGTVREEIDLSEMFSVVSFTVSGSPKSPQVTPKLWLRDSALYAQALLVLSAKFPKIDFTFEPFIPDNMPASISVTEVRKRFLSPKSEEEEFNDILGNINEKTLEYHSVNAIRKIANNANVDKILTIIVRRIWINNDNQLLIKMCSRIDASCRGFLKDLLHCLETTPITGIIEDNRKLYQNHLDIAIVQLKMQLYRDRVTDVATGELLVERSDILKHVSKTMDDIKTDALIRLLRIALNEMHDQSLANEIRKHIELITQRAGKHYYLVCDIFDDYKKLMKRQPAMPLVTTTADSTPAQTTTTAASSSSPSVYNSPAPIDTAVSSSPVASEPAPKQRLVPQSQLFGFMRRGYPPVNGSS